jgi:protein SCO1/2
MVVLVAAAMAFAIVQPIKVLPRLRPAPGYALTDQHGERFSSEDARGVITLYTFVPLDCGATCDQVATTMATVRDRVAAEVDLGGVDFRLATVVLDPDVPTATLAAEATRAGGGASAATASVDWVWLTGSTSQIANVVGLGFRRSADPDDFSPSYAIVDGWGTIRGEYRYATRLDDADKLVRHIDVLGGELRNPSGFANIAYDAAHAFQCYP